MEKIKIEIADNEELRNQRKELTIQLSAAPAIRNFLMQEGMDSALVERFPMHFKKLYDQLKLCAGCHGLAECQLPNRGYVQSLAYDEALKYVLKPCRYKQEYEKKYAHLQNFVVNDMPVEDRLVLINDAFDDNESSKDYLQGIEQIVDWMSEPTFGGFYLYGPVGVGKTYLAACIANKLARDGQQVAFINVPAFVNRIKDAFNDNAEQERLKETAKRAGLLVLDDIGAEMISPWYRDEILLPILDWRMNKRKFTVFTSNYPLKELHDRLGYTDKGGYEEIAAQRVIERINSLARELLIKGKNRRDKA